MVPKLTRIKKIKRKFKPNNEFHRVAKEITQQFYKNNSKEIKGHLSTQKGNSQENQMFEKIVAKISSGYSKAIRAKLHQVPT